MERPSSNDDSAFPPDPPPGSDPEPTPRFPKGRPAQREASPGTLAGNVEVTPLDDDENLEDGIEVKET